MTAAAATALLFNIIGGCCTNVLLLEYIIGQAPGCTMLITLVQFATISLLGGRRLLEPRQIPLYHWLAMVVLFWSVSMLTNIALDYRVEMPLHILLKSGSLVINMLLARLILGRRYRWTQVIAILLLSIGVLMATFASAKQGSPPKDFIDPPVDFGEWSVGVSLLAASLVLGSLLGIYQEQVYRVYGKHWQEGLVYSHVLGLPFFLMFQQDLWSQYSKISIHPVQISFGQLSIAPFIDDSTFAMITSQIFPQSILDFKFPAIWLSIAGNAITQMICVTGVHQLSASTSSLTVNLALMLRRLISLLLSVYLFHDKFEQGHIYGAVMVFGGSALYYLA